MNRRLIKRNAVGSDRSIGEVIGQAMQEVGETGVIKTEDGRGTASELETVEGCSSTEDLFRRIS